MTQLLLFWARVVHSLGMKQLYQVKVFIWVAFIIGVGLDINWAIGDGPTISSVTKAYSWQWSTIPFAYGVLTGHLFWHVRGSITWRWVRLGILGMLGIGIIAFDVWGYYKVMPIIPLVFSIPLGRLLWPQSVPFGQALFIRKK